ncbi:hypothetical protein EON73_02250, partial [bacterium]
SNIAKYLYKEKYYHLQNRIKKEYLKVQGIEKTHFDILSKLLISGEDHRFLYHIGFDVIAILRALKNRVFLNKIEGASTIEQQLVRVITNNYERNLQRKIQEILLATSLTSLVSREYLPAIYLNIAYYGTGMNDLSQALKKFGIKNMSEISLDEAAEIVSRIKYPEPKNGNTKRLNQIRLRKTHLILLYNKHLNKKTFKIYG